MNEIQYKLDQVKRDANFNNTDAYNSSQYMPMQMKPSRDELSERYHAQYKQFRELNKQDENKYSHESKIKTANQSVHTILKSVSI